MSKKQNKQGVSLRLDSNIVEILKSRAESRKMSQADIVQESLNLTFDGGDTTHLLVKLESALQKLDNVKKDYEELSKKTGKKISRTKRITMTLSKKEFLVIKKESHKRDVSMSTMLREFIFSKPSSSIGIKKNVLQLT